MYPKIFNFYLRNIRNLDIIDSLKNAGFPEVEGFLRYLLLYRSIGSLKNALGTNAGEWLPHLNNL